MNDDEKEVRELVKKAAMTAKTDDAMRLSQAALNCAHALQVLAATKKGF